MLHLRGNHQLLLMLVGFVVFLRSDQGVRDTAKCLLNLPLIRKHHLLFAGFAQARTRANPATCKDGLRERSSKAPKAGRTSKEAAQRGALQPAVFTATCGK